MAIYHLHAQIITRGKGQSAIAASAYRSATKMTNEYDGITHNYLPKKNVDHSEILLCENAKFTSREHLWNEVEKIEKQSNAQLAREMNIALPVELTKEENIELVKKYVQDNFVSQGMCADIALHNLNTQNPHAHIMLTMRSIDIQGNFLPKSRKEYILDANGEKILTEADKKNIAINPDCKKEYKSRKINTNNWDNKNNIDIWREKWAEVVNLILKKKGLASRISHVTNLGRGITPPNRYIGKIGLLLRKKGMSTFRDTGTYPEPEKIIIPEKLPEVKMKKIKQLSKDKTLSDIEKKLIQKQNKIKCLQNKLKHKIKTAQIRRKCAEKYKENLKILEQIKPIPVIHSKILYNNLFAILKNDQKIVEFMTAKRFTTQRIREVLAHSPTKTLVNPTQNKNIKL